MGGRSPFVLFLLVVGALVVIAGGITMASGFRQPTLLDPNPREAFVVGGVIAAGGLLMVIGGFILDNIQDKFVKKGAPVIDANATVLAKYAYREGRVVVSEWEMEEPGTKLYVRLKRSDGISAEYECALETFERCGEGMTGEAMIKGRWLGSFRPYIAGQLT